MDELKWVVIDKRGKVIAAFLRRWQAEFWMIREAGEGCTVIERGQGNESN